MGSQRIVQHNAGLDDALCFSQTHEHLIVQSAEPVHKYGKGILYMDLDLHIFLRYTL